jgi:hypothetical protein
MSTPITTIHPTRQAQRLHLSHLATTHRTPLSKRVDGAVRRRATAFTPMARDPLSVEPSQQPTRNQTQTHES